MVEGFKSRMSLLETTRFLVKFIEILEKTNNKFRTSCENSASRVKWKD